MKYHEIALLLGLTGCAHDVPTVERETVAADYRCAAVMLKKVKRECKDTAASWTEYCETQAKRRYCERLK